MLRIADVQRQMRAQFGKDYQTTEMGMDGNVGNIQRYTQVTLYPKAPLYNIIIIVDTVLRQKRNFKTRKVMESTISPYCHFGMDDQGLPADRLTCAAYIDGKKR